MLIGHKITHLPSNRDGRCKGVPFRRKGFEWVRVLFPEGIEYVKAEECRVKCGSKAGSSTQGGNRD